MAIVIDGDGTVTGISVGGLPDGIVDAGTLATNSVDSAELVDGAVDDSHMAAMAASKLTGTLPAISGANLTALNATNLGSGTVPTARLGSGTANNTVHLRGDGTWAVAEGKGTLLQQVDSSKGTFSQGGTTYTDTGLSVAITPISASSVLYCEVIAQGCRSFAKGAASNGGKLKLVRDLGAGFVDCMANYPFNAGNESFDNTCGSDILTHRAGSGQTTEITYKLQGCQVSTPGTNGSACWVAYSKIRVWEYEN